MLIKVLLFNESSFGFLCDFFVIETLRFQMMRKDQKIILGLIKYHRHNAKCADQSRSVIEKSGHLVNRRLQNR